MAEQVETQEGDGYQVVMLKGGSTGTIEVSKLSWPDIQALAELSLPVFAICQWIIRQIVITPRQVKVKDGFGLSGKLKEEASDLFSLWEEWNDLGADSPVAAEAKVQLDDMIPNLRPDMANFKPAMYREIRRLRAEDEIRIKQAKKLYSKPNDEEDWIKFVERWVWDLLWSGEGVVRLFRNLEKVAAEGIEGKGGRVTRMTALKGDTVHPIRTYTILSLVGYAQELMTEGQLLSTRFEAEDIMTIQYAPSTALGKGMTPLQVLVSQLREQLHYDHSRHLDSKHGKPPDGVLVTTPSKDNVAHMGGDGEGGMTRTQKVDLEAAINRRSDPNILKVLGLKKGVEKIEFIRFRHTDKDSQGLARQEQIQRNACAVYGVSWDMIFGGAAHKIRTGSVMDRKVSHESGVKPITMKMKGALTTRTLDDTVHDGLELVFLDEQMTLSERLEAGQKAVGLYTVNEIREDILDKEVRPEAIYDTIQNPRTGQSYGDDPNTTENEAVPEEERNLPGETTLDDENERLDEVEV